MNKYYLVEVEGESLRIKTLEAKNVREWAGNAAAHSFVGKGISMSVWGKNFNNKKEIIEILESVENFPEFFRNLPEKRRKILGFEVCRGYNYLSGSFVFFRKDGWSGEIKEIPQEAAWGEVEYADWY